MTKILRAENVTTERLHNVQFNVLQGQCLTIIGPSGAGKSSLLLLLNRMVTPIEGTIYYKERQLIDYDISKLRKEVGIVFQNPSLFEETVEDNLQYGPIINGDKWDVGDAHLLLDWVQLPKSYLTRPISQLSGGEQQRIALARVLANNPEVLLLDEVTSALDVKTIEVIESLLTILMVEKKKTIVMVTHDLQQAKRLGNHTLFIKDGRLVEHGETESFFRSPQTEELRYFLKE
ncbi:ABC transporter ATP-binding protein [Bacillus taeanensis]|uniref:Phosphate ABC transporter ATP-binding protein n=1 Tax=Bacillus taeanensis TaxID=273032 RepID=A0A366Y380_9BACI|nr:ATP-binding cassette domain-containing protein [Bacillus taeanensis]RBW70651.1 phosphate ABC transporter ATP-binding protein [Bacillus taeanensis]